jgi:hypothetical protein
MKSDLIAKEIVDLELAWKGYSEVLISERDEARKLAEHYRDSWLEIDRTVCDVAGVGPCSPNRLPWEEKK